MPMNIGEQNPPPNCLNGIGNPATAILKASDLRPLQLNDKMKQAIASFMKDHPTTEKGVQDHLAEESFMKPIRVSRTFIKEFILSIPPKPNTLPDMMKERYELPAYKQRSEILNAINSHQVVLITGGTGCGKTTQVPQFLMEEAHANGSNIRIICTQPRRLAAVAIAKRVAKERNEKCGSTVGYHIRFEKKSSAKTVLTFSTSGVLLRMLTGNQIAQDVSHIVLDEIHERDKIGDCLLIYLKEAVRKRNDLKIILMSATLEDHLDIFKNYFGQDKPAQHVHIPSRLHLVETYYLEDILEMTGYSPDSISDFDSSFIESDSLPNGTPGTAEDHCSMPNASSIDAELLGRYNEFRPLIAQQVKSRQVGEESKQSELGCTHAIDYDLISHVIMHIVNSDVDGAILVFLPGNEDINEVHDRLESIPDGKTEKIILHLHSQMETNDQQLVFQQVPSSCRKIILSTNIAEASLTIDDVVFVIDCGKVKEKSYDYTSRISQLKVSWIAKSNAEQRLGRAGRCRPGFCFRLYSVDNFANMRSTQTAEMQRAAIHDVVLHARMFSPEHMSVKEFLQLAPEPPLPFAIEHSISFLEVLGAMYSTASTSDMNTSSGSTTGLDPALTAMGRLIAHLPLDPQLGRLLLFGLATKCLSPVVTLVAALSHRDPFVLPKRDIEEKKNMNQRGGGLPIDIYLTI